MSTGITYYSDCKSLGSITSPIIDNGTLMRYGGTFSKSTDNKTFDNPCAGLKRNQSNNGFIYCNDASKLFNAYKGKVGISIQFSEDIVDGVYNSIKNTDLECLIWGVNIGKQTISVPSIYVKLTKDGIKFTISTSLGQYSIVDNVTNVSSGENVFLEFFWDSERTYKTEYDYTIGIPDNILEDASESISSNSFDSFWATMAIRVNNVTTVVGNPPISTIDSLSNLIFCILGTSYYKNNLECTINSISIANDFIKEGQEEWYNSSSSSIIDPKSDSSLSSNPDSLSSSSNEGKVAIFKFNESSGSKWYNTYDYNDYITASPSVASRNMMGIIRGAMYVTGNYYVGTLNWTPASQFSISFWFNYLVAADANTYFYILKFSPTQYIWAKSSLIEVVEIGEGIEAATSSTLINPHWNFVVYNFNGVGNPVTIYINNVLQSLTGTIIPTNSFSSISTFTTGPFYRDIYTISTGTAAIDMLSFYNFSLTAGQINTLWNNGKGTEDNLI